MTNLKDRLIRLGNKKPELRAHLYEVIAYTERIASGEDFRISIRDGRSDKEEFQGSVVEFIKENEPYIPESEVRSKLKGVGDSMMIGGGAQPLMKIVRISSRRPVANMTKHVMYDLTMVCRTDRGLRQLEDSLNRRSDVPKVEYLHRGRTPSDDGRLGDALCVHSVSHHLILRGSDSDSDIKHQLEDLWEDLAGQSVEIRVEDVLPI